MGCGLWPGLRRGAATHDGKEGGGCRVRAVLLCAQWSCTTCTLDNDDAVFVCAACGCSRLGRVSADPEPQRPLATPTLYATLPLML